MPSIPQSLLWISLVILWLFVLVPMLTSKRDAVRRTSDVALATRVLNSAAGARLLKRGKPAAGHRSDPYWQHEDDGEGADSDDDFDEEDDADVSPRVGSVLVVAAVAVEEAGPDYLDVDVVDDVHVALPVGDSVQAAQTVGRMACDVSDDLTDDMDGNTGGEVGDPADPVLDEDGHDYANDEYETVEDTSGLEPEEDLPTTLIPRGSRHHGYNPLTVAAVTARKYNFRKRVLMAMALILVASASFAYTVAPAVWWLVGTAATVTVLYLAYLRRQTRIEDRLRRRRMQRMARSRLGVENTRDREFDVVPARLRRPGAVVLEIDDEDPSFEHLDYAPFAGGYDLPRAAGQ